MAREKDDPVINFVRPTLPTDRMAFLQDLHKRFVQGIRVFYRPSPLGELAHTDSIEWAVAVGTFCSWFGANQWQLKIARVRAYDCQVIFFRSLRQPAIISLADGREHP